MNIELENLSLRKRMLIVRAELERTELAGQIEKVRDATRLSRLFGASLRSTSAKGVFSTGLWLLRRFPVLTSSLSLVLARLRSRPDHGGGALSRVGTAVKWAGLGVLGLQAWRWWRRHQPPRDERYR